MKIAASYERLIFVAIEFKWVHNSCNCREWSAVPVYSIFFSVARVKRGKDGLGVK